MSLVTSLRRRAKRALGRSGAERPAAEPAGAGPSEGASTHVLGVVEDISRRAIAGWVSVPADAPPTRISVRLGGFEVTATYAKPGDSMSGIFVGADGTVIEPRSRQASAPAAGEIQAEHNWRAKPLPGPRGDRRNSRQQIRTFAFRVAGMWPYVQNTTQVRVLADGRPLPIAGHGMFARPRKSGPHTPAELEELFAQGYVLTQMGELMLSKKHDTDYQRSAMALYERVGEILHDEYGYEIFLMYGTLLGAVRDGGYISHDADFDVGYVSRHETGPEAASELADIALTMVRHGLGADLRARLLHIHDRDNDEFKLDLFHTYFEDERHRFPFGVAGTSTLTRADWSGTKEIDFPGGRARVPANDERFVAHLYGEDWRLPRPGFNWHLDRTDHAPEAALSPHLRTKIYWADFYSRTEYTEGSTFCEFVRGLDDLPFHVVDIGCGDGRDACAFGTAGRAVLGLDQSPIGIEHATAHAAARGLANVRFEVCDASDAAALGRVLAAELETDGPVLFYLRFFLHAITDGSQATLLSTLDRLARPGDWFAAEFRTDKDAEQTKVHGKHYRRFQNAQEFVADLRSRGWRIEHSEEGTGLSPYGEEDPVLARVIATRE